MTIVMDKCLARVRVRDAYGDDVKATTIKEKQKKQKNICLIYIEIQAKL